MTRDSQTGAPRADARLRAASRMIAAAVAVAVAVVLSLARLLSPDPRGLGTHEQLGLFPCPSAWLFRIPCPFCGMTTAFALMAHGQVAAAFRVQPAGALAFIVAVVVLVAAACAALSGRWFPAPAPERIAARVLPYAVALLLAAWVYKLVMAFLSAVGAPAP